MTRNNFLQNHWKKYPNPKCLKYQDQLICGRVVHIGHRIVKIKRNQLVFDLEWSTLNCEIDEFLGESINPELLRVGDVIAFNKKGSTFYLLSPNKNQSFKEQSCDLSNWTSYINTIRNYFVEQGFDEARTPYLVTSPGVDAHIDFLQVVGTKTNKQWTLPTSPEIHLKKLLCQGVDRVFEMKTCFRDDLHGRHHRSEFEMLEWYRSYEPLDALVEDLGQLIKAFQDISMAKRTLSQVFADELGVKLTPETTSDQLKGWLCRSNIDFSSGDDWNDLFFRLYMEKIEPQLGRQGPEVIVNFPPQQASLARLTADGWAERFELYWKGVEIANAYSELNDPEENKTRFSRENSLKERENRVLSPLDEEFFYLLNQGMPPASGIALGLDRLYMVLFGHEDIGQTRPF